MGFTIPLPDGAAIEGLPILLEDTNGGPGACVPPVLIRAHVSSDMLALQAKVRCSTQLHSTPLPELFCPSLALESVI